MVGISYLQLTLQIENKSPRTVFPKSMGIKNCLCYSTYILYMGGHIFLPGELADLRPSQGAS